MATLTRCALACRRTRRVAGVWLACAGLRWSRRFAVALDGRRLVAVSVPLFLVSDHLAIELVGQRVDRRVHVGIDAFGVDVLAADVKVGGDLLPELVDREHDIDVDHVIEMPGDAVELRRHVIADRRCDHEMMAGQVQIHPALLPMPSDGSGVRCSCADSPAESAAPRGTWRWCAGRRRCPGRRAGPRSGYRSGAYCDPRRR